MSKLLSDYLKETFGCRVYKIVLNGGFTCPNRDGKILIAPQWNANKRHVWNRIQKEITFR